MQAQKPMPGRRDFLEAALLAGAAGAASCGGSAAKPAGSRFELAETSVADLSDGMRRGRWTARSICELYLRRIDSIDRRGPALNAVIEINPDALRIADRLDAERAAGKIRGALHGVPVMLKDNIDTADRMQTTAGSPALVDSGVQRDAWVAARLRAAGAVILAKTNLSEWANFRSRDSVSGWSGRGGLTRNPYALDRNPCGSSSGSAAAVSANLTALAVGTETNGSIVCPASVNGIAGIKPTVGLIGRSGIVPIAHSQDTAGPMARTVADAAALLGALTGIDPRDAATAGSAGRSYADYRQFLDPDGLRGARIGLIRRYYGRRETMDAILDHAAQTMQDAGAELADIEALPVPDGTDAAAFEVMLYEFKAGLNAYLADLGPSAKVRTLADVIRFNRDRQDEALRWFGQDLLEAAQRKGPLSERAYGEALRKSRGGSRAAIDATLQERRLDALFAPTAGPAWITDPVHGDRSGFPGSSSAAARAGYPNITVPAGFIAGLPVGVSFFGAAWDEPRLLRIAYAFEQAAPVRREPQFAPAAAALPKMEPQRQHGEADGRG